MRIFLKTKTEKLYWQILQKGPTTKTQFRKIMPPANFARVYAKTQHHNLIMWKNQTLHLKKPITLTKFNDKITILQTNDNPTTKNKKRTQTLATPK